MIKNKKHKKSFKGLLTTLAAFTLALGMGVGGAHAFGVRVSAAMHSVTITRSNFPSGKLVYNEDDPWNAIDTAGNSITGTFDLSSTVAQTTMQSKNTNIANGFNNHTKVLPGNLSAVHIVSAEGTSRNWTLYCSKSTPLTIDNFSTDGTSLGAKAVTGTNNAVTKWESIDTTKEYKYVYLSIAGGASYTNSITLYYDIVGGAPAPDPTSINITAAGGVTTVGIGRKLQLSATVSPSEAIQTVTWSSSSNATATVDSSGLVTGVKTGPVVITAASTEKPSITKTISLTVFDPFAGYDGFETFEEHTLTGTSYSSGSYEGDYVTITYADARPDQGFQISGKGIMFRGTDSYIEFTLESGISELSFEWMKAHTAAGDRQLGIYINGIKFDETEAKDEQNVVQVYSKTFATPYSGTTIVKIAGLLGSSSSARQLTLDNVKWKDGPEVTFGVLSSLVINTDNVKKEYYNGDLLSLGGLIATAYDTEGRYKIVTGEVTSSPLEGYEFILADALAGTKSINITFSEGGKQASQSFSVTVIELVLPTNIIFDVSAVHTNAGDSGTALVAGSLETKDDIIFGNKKDDVKDISIQIDEGDEATRVYYAGTDHGVAGIQPLKLGSNNNKGNIKLDFVEEIAVITKVTIYARRISANAANATLQVNDAPAQNIGVSGKADVKFGAYEFEGPFGNELVIRNNTNLAVYVFGIDIEVMTHDEEALAFANEVMSGVGLGAKGNCHAVLDELEGLYDGLSALAKEKFETSTEQVFVDARARLTYLEAWTAVNTPADPSSHLSKNQKSTTVAALVIGAIGMTTLGGYFLLNKKKRKLTK